MAQSTRKRTKVKPYKGPARVKSGAKIKKKPLVEYVAAGSRRKTVDLKEDRQLGDIRRKGSPAKPKPKDKMKGTNKKKTSSRSKSAKPWREVNPKKYQNT